MADNFNLNKFIRNNPLLKESIGGYRDIEPMKEGSDEDLFIKVIPGILKNVNVYDMKRAFDKGEFDSALKSFKDKGEVSQEDMAISILHDYFAKKIGGSKPMEEIVSELDKPELIYNEDWINDSVDGKKIGNWSCYYEDNMGVLYWIHDNILSEDITVYATPNWDGAKGIAVEVQVNYGDHLVDHATIGDPSYPDFESYAQDIAPFLKKVEDKYFAGGYDEYFNSEDNIEDAENINELEGSVDIKDVTFISKNGGEAYEEVQVVDEMPGMIKFKVLKAHPNSTRLGKDFTVSTGRFYSDYEQKGFAPKMTDPGYMNRD
jgi:hypothetical protein